MDLGAALSALSNAMTLAKALRGIQQDYDLASVRAQMAEIYDSLADARIALADAKSVIAERELQIKELEGGPVPGEPCPYCGARAMRMTHQLMHGQMET
jgi:DNA repair exonuclease SbcCD ATPase subunit